MTTLAIFRTSISRNSAGIIIKNIFTKLVQWRSQSRSRKHLADLPDHLLNDVGLTKEQARRESERPFWH